jgi:hypothetical protein
LNRGVAAHPQIEVFHGTGAVDTPSWRGFASALLKEFFVKKVPKVLTYPQ